MPKSDLEYGACDNLMDGFSFSARAEIAPTLIARKLDFWAAVSNYQQKIGPSTMGLGSLAFLAGFIMVSRLAS